MASGRDFEIDYHEASDSMESQRPTKASECLLSCALRKLDGRETGQTLEFRTAEVQCSIGSAVVLKVNEEIDA